MIHSVQQLLINIVIFFAAKLSNVAHLFDCRLYLRELQAGKRRTRMTNRGTMYVLNAVVLCLTTLQTGVSGENGLKSAFRIHRHTIHLFY